MVHIVFSALSADLVCNVESDRSIVLANSITVFCCNADCDRSTEHLLGEIVYWEAVGRCQRMVVQVVVITPIRSFGKISGFPDVVWVRYFWYSMFISKTALWNIFSTTCCRQTDRMESPVILCFCQHQDFSIGFTIQVLIFTLTPFLHFLSLINSSRYVSYMYIDIWCSFFSIPQTVLAIGVLESHFACRKSGFRSGFAVVSFGTWA